MPAKQLAYQETYLEEHTTGETANRRGLHVCKKSFRVMPDRTRGKSTTHDGTTVEPGALATCNLEKSLKTA